MTKSAINLKEVGINVTILAHDAMLAEMMDINDSTYVDNDFSEEAIQTLLEVGRNKVVKTYKQVTKYPLKKNSNNERWESFPVDCLSFYFLYTLVRGKKIKLVHPDSFDKVISKGLFIDLTQGGKPDLVDGIDYIQYVNL